MPSPRQLRPASALLLAHALLPCALASPPRASAVLGSGVERASAVQQPPGKSAKQAGGRRRTKAGGDAKSREERERRQAVALLIETADAARTLDDPADRAEVQALAADALWPHDEQAARAIFTRAWAAADEADADERREGAEEEPGTETGAVASVRRDLVPVVAKRDTRLAEKLMEELHTDEAKSGRAEEAARGGAKEVENVARGDERRAARGRNPWRELRPESAWRFDLAGALMREGEYERAAQLAAPLAAEGVSAQLMTFLLDLRPNLPRGADEIYARLLERTAADAAADANDVLLLSSYVVSPDLLVVVDAQGSVLLNSLAFFPADDARRRPPTEIPAHVRALFYRAAAAVLSRQNVGGAEDAIAPFFAIGRLLPFFEREAPHHAPALHARRAALAAEIDAARRERLAPQMEVRSVAHKNPTDPLRPQLEAVARAGDEGVRDSARSSAVSTAVRHKLWERARTLAADIKDDARRRDALNLITAEQVLSVAEGFKDEEDANAWERAAGFVRGADVSPLARSVGLAQAAELAARKGRPERAAELLREAAVFAEQAGADASLRYGAFSTLTAAAARVGSAQTWELLAATIRAANAVESYADFFTPVEVARADSRDGQTERDYSVGFLKPPTPADVFGAAARLDFSRALAEARTLKDGAARAFAQISVARARLDAGAPGVRKAGEKQ